MTTTQRTAFDFTIQKVTKLNTWIFIAVRNQVVSGEINCFKFEEFISQNVEEYCVWSQPWNNNFMELTLPDGSKISQGGSQTSSSNPSPVVTGSQNIQNVVGNNQNTNSPAQAPSTSGSSATPIVGGFSQSNTQSLSILEQAAQDFLLRTVSMLSSWTLTNVKTQVVAG